MDNIKKKWFMDSVVYQVYPRSFNDTDGDGIGDIRGIIEKLPYLKNLGIDILWLSPFYDSPNEDNGYDIRDYYKVSEEFGTEEDIRELFSKAKEIGIKVVVDLVVNHSSMEHSWFKESRKSRNNKYSDYYIWKNGNKDREDELPNGWQSVFSGPAWKYEENRDQYYLHVFAEGQPDLNWENRELREEVYRIMEYWIEMGAQGFRMDVINLISKQFRNNEYRGEEYFFNGPKIHDYLREMNEKVLKGRNLITVGECPGATTEDALKFSNLDDSELSMIFTFQHMDIDSGDGKWDFKDFDLMKLKKILSKWQKDLHGKAWNSLYLCNHDQPRVVSRFGDDGRYRIESAKMLAHMIHTMEGTPYIYQGEELGMTNCPFNVPEDIRDIESLNAIKENRTTGRFSEEHMREAILRKGRDNARTPMQWSSSPNGGFTEGKPWIMVNPNYIDINAEDQLEDKDSIFNFYRNLIKARKEYEVIALGDFHELMEEDGEIYAFSRTLIKDGFKEELISLNSFSDKKREIPLEILGINSVNMENLKIINSNYEKKLQTENNRLQLNPWHCISLYSKTEYKKS